MLSGKCLCGTVSYEITGDLSNLLHCHCSLCRKSHGASFVTFAATSIETFKFTSGLTHLQPSSGPGHINRNFCGTCGSTMPFEEGGSISVPVGTLVSLCPTIAVGHIFTNSRAPWYEITDDLKQYEEFPASMQRQAIDPLPLPDSDCPGGTCLCGQISFEITETPLGMMNCHCDRCKRSRGAAHATNLFVASSGFRWRHGESHLQRYKLPEAERFSTAFCSSCGSLMPRTSTDSKTVNIPAGSLNGDPGIKPGAHIYTANKANWFRITDDLPQYEQGIKR